jgi:hypothetical protein
MKSELLWTPLLTATVLQLHRRTFYRAIGTEDATITRFRLYQSVALNAFMEETARIHRHLFRCCMTALQTDEHGFERYRLRYHCFGKNMDGLFPYDG